MEQERRRMEERHFVEDVGLLFEEMGFPRMAGRILGWLLICDPPEQSAGQLAGALQASKGSLSTMTRLLLQMNLIERVAVPGERRDYFRLKPGAWISLVRQELYEFVALRQLTERGLELLQSDDSEVKQRLEDARDLFAYLEREYPVLIERWEQEHKSPTRRKK